MAGTVRDMRALKYFSDVHRWHVLLYCVNQRMTHLQRMLPLELGTAQLKQFDDAITGEIFNIMGVLQEHRDVDLVNTCTSCGHCPWAWAVQRCAETISTHGRGRCVPECGLSAPTPPRCRQPLASTLACPQWSSSATCLCSILAESAAGHPARVSSHIEPRCHAPAEYRRIAWGRRTYRETWT
jgi:hypothetical protein